MYVYPISGREAILLLLLFVFGAIFSRLQPYFIEAPLLPYTYVFFLFCAFLAYYPAARPADPLALGRFLAVLIGGIYAAWIVIGQVLIRQNFSSASLIVLAGAILAPLVAGWCYSFAAGRRPVH